MPYEIKSEGDESCIHNSETGEKKGCHKTHEAALEQMQALYANEGVKKSLEELKKCYPEYYPEYAYVSTTSLAELESLREAREKERKAHDWVYDYRTVLDAIFSNPILNKVEKITKLEALGKEFVAGLKKLFSSDVAKSEPEEHIDIEEIPVLHVSISKDYTRNDDKQLAYGVVLVPGQVDAQGDTISADEIEKAAHEYMVKSIQETPIDLQHVLDLPRDRAVPVESYIAPVDMEVGGHQIIKGSWVMVTHVPDNEIWDQIKKGAIMSYSIRGWGKRTRV